MNALWTRLAADGASLVGYRFAAIQTNAPPSCSGLVARERPFSIFQDSGADIRALRLQAAALAVVEFPGPDDCQSNPVAVVSAAGKAGALCDSHSATDQPGSHSSILFGSVQQALLAVAFAKWQSGKSTPQSCACCLLERLVHQRSQLEVYLKRLRRALQAAAAEWRSAGLLYNTNSYV